MPRPEDTLEQLARLARSDAALHAASERKPASSSRSDEAAPVSVLPDSLTEPLSEAQRASFVDAIQARLASERARPAAPATVTSLGRRPALVAVVALTAAAAGVLFALRGSPDAEGPLSRYEVRLEGAEQAERGDPQAQGLLRLRPSSTLRFELRPRSDERGSVRVRAVLGATGSRETRALDITQEQSPAGAVRVAADLPASLPEHGELSLYVGRASAIDRMLAPGSAAAPSDVQEFRWRFERAP